MGTMLQQRGERRPTWKIIAAACLMVTVGFAAGWCSYSVSIASSAKDSTMAAERNYTPDGHFDDTLPTCPATGDYKCYGHTCCATQADCTGSKRCKKDLK